MRRHPPANALTRSVTGKSLPGRFPDSGPLRGLAFPIRRADPWRSRPQAPITVAGPGGIRPPPPLYPPLVWPPEECPPHIPAPPARSKEETAGVGARHLPHVSATTPCRVRASLPLVRCHGRNRHAPAP